MFRILIRSHWHSGSGSLFGTQIWILISRREKVHAEKLKRLLMALNLKEKATSDPYSNFRPDPCEMNRYGSEIITPGI